MQAVNSTFGTDEWKPIRAFYENNHTQAVSGLRLYDVLLVNSVIDGINLVAKEGAVVNTQNGSIIISESIGAYDQLRTAVLPVSPTDIEGTMQAMYKALTMSQEERQKRATMMCQSVEREDVINWLKIQIENLVSLR